MSLFWNKAPSILWRLSKLPNSDLISPLPKSLLIYYKYKWKLNHGNALCQQRKQYRKVVMFYVMKLTANLSWWYFTSCSIFTPLNKDIPMSVVLSPEQTILILHDHASEEAIRHYFDGVPRRPVILPQNKPVDNQVNWCAFQCLRSFVKVLKCLI